MKKLNEADENCLVSMAEWYNDHKTHKRQIGFLAQYLLDNICKQNKKQILTFFFHKETFICLVNRNKI